MTPTDDLTQLTIAVARIEGKLDHLIDRSNDHEDRMRAIERWRWLIVGAALGVGAAAGGVSSAVLH